MKHEYYEKIQTVGGIEIAKMRIELDAEVVEKLKEALKCVEHVEEEPCEEKPAEEKPAE